MLKKNHLYFILYSDIFFSYLQIKKLEGGERSDSCIVSGIVCSKNIANKAMASRISGPKILLLQCSIIYQRVEGKLLSLEPVIMQVNLVKLYSIPEVKIPGNNQFLSGIKNLHISIGDSSWKCKITDY